MSTKTRGTWLAIALALCAGVGVGRAVASEDAAPALPVAGARLPAPGLLTAGQPSPEELEAAIRAGYRTVIDLRAADEPGHDWEREAVERLGGRYVHLPVAGAAGLTRDNVTRLDESLREAEERGGVLLHCASGNRVGALLALREAWVRGAKPEDALRFGTSAGLTKLEPAVRERLEIAPATGEPAP